MTTAINNRVTIENLEAKANELIDQSYTVHFHRQSFTINPAEHGYTFEWSNRRSALGDCSKNSKVVRLSRFLVENSESTFDLWVDTILHEIAHAIDFLIRKKSNHDRIWKHIAKTIGADPTRTTNLDTDATKYKYTATCPGCGTSHGHSRKWKKRKSCGKCSPYFNEKFEYVVTQNY